MTNEQQAEQRAALEAVSQAARWAVPVGVAIITTGHAGFPMSGDHRPRHGRHYPRGEGEVDSGHE